MAQRSSAIRSASTATARETAAENSIVPLRTPSYFHSTRRVSFL